MSDLIIIENLKNLMIKISGNTVLLDADVAVIYGVETKRINEAVKNNLDRFPSGYVIELNDDDKNELVENFDQFNRLKHSSTTPRAFTEKACICSPPFSKANKPYRQHCPL